ncbi:hypothetical protein NKH77_36785 [Streptomyces sp. M19]
MRRGHRRGHPAAPGTALPVRLHGDLQHHAGDQVQLRQGGHHPRHPAAALNTVLGTTVPCRTTEPLCGAWQMGFFGTAGSWYFPVAPSGEQIFATGAPPTWATGPTRAPTG